MQVIRELNRYITGIITNKDQKLLAISGDALTISMFWWA